MARDPKTWMSGIDDRRFLDRLSIPGTHDSASLYTGIRAVFTNYPICQSQDLEWQLDNGIRYFDLRLKIADWFDRRWYFEGRDTLALVHNCIYQKDTFYNVLRKFGKFLQTNPRETILVRVKQECSNDNNEYRNLLKRNLELLTQREEIRFWLDNSCLPRLGQVRKHIILLSNEPYIGQGFMFGDPRQVKVQDKWENPDYNDKKKEIEKHISDSIHLKDAFYINHLSASGSYTSRRTAWDYAQEMNPYMSGLITKSGVYSNKPEGLGVIVMDYAGQCRSSWSESPDNTLIKNIIERNIYPNKILFS